MTNNPVGWFEIYVQDIDRAKTFYEAILRVKLDDMSAPDMAYWAFPMDMNRPGASGALCKMNGFPSGGNSTLVYFSCADCATEAGRVAEAGGRVQREKMAIGEHGFIALAFDTEGNLFGLHSMQ
jgi:predicted enzyme related to lactoylglutathione lyase